MATDYTARAMALDAIKKLEAGGGGGGGGGGGFTPNPTQLKAINSTATKDKINKIAVNEEVSVANKLTLGYRRKNVMKITGASTTNSGVAFVVNADGSVTVSGSNTSVSAITKWLSAPHSFIMEAGAYIMTGCPEGGSDETYKLHFEDGAYAVDDTGNGVNIVDGTYNEHKVAIAIGPGYTFTAPKTFYPMIRPAEIADDTFESYQPSVAGYFETISDDIEISMLTAGAVGERRKNLLEITGAGRTHNGVTFTVNADGSVTADGTATGGNATVTLAASVDIPKGDYVLNGCPEGGAHTKYYLACYDTAWGNQMRDEGYGVNLHFAEATRRIFTVVVANGTTVENLTFYPMLRYSFVKDDEFEEYEPPMSERLKAIESNPFSTAIVVSASEFEELDTSSYPAGQIFAIWDDSGATSQ